MWLQNLRLYKIMSYKKFITSILSMFDLQEILRWHFVFNGVIGRTAN